MNGVTWTLGTIGVLAALQLGRAVRSGSGVRLGPLLSAKSTPEKPWWSRPGGAGHRVDPVFPDVVWAVLNEGQTAWLVVRKKTQDNDVWVVTGYLEPKSDGGAAYRPKGVDVGYFKAATGDVVVRFRSAVQARRAVEKYADIIEMMLDGS